MVELLRLLNWRGCFDSVIWIFFPIICRQWRSETTESLSGEPAFGSGVRTCTNWIPPAGMLSSLSRRSFQEGGKENMRERIREEVRKDERNFWKYMKVRNPEEGYGCRWNIGRPPPPNLHQSCVRRTMRYIRVCGTVAQGIDRDQSWWQVFSEYFHFHRSVETRLSLVIRPKLDVSKSCSGLRDPKLCSAECSGSGAGS